MKKILIVEDNISINTLLKLQLEMAGYECEQVMDGLEAGRMITEKQYLLILLDIMLPGKNGFELLPEIVKKGTPVMILTAKGSVSDRVKGLKMGADDYIIKPFAMSELLARVEAVLRRNHKKENYFLMGDVRVDMDSHCVTKDGKNVELTPQEYALLEILIVNQGIAVSREELLTKAWGYACVGDTRTVDIHIQRLRKKLGWKDNLATVYKYGYRLEKES